MVHILPPYSPLQLFSLSRSFNFNRATYLLELIFQDAQLGDSSDIFWDEFIHTIHASDILTCF